MKRTDLLTVLALIFISLSFVGMGIKIISPKETGGTTLVWKKGTETHAANIPAGAIFYLISEKQTYYGAGNGEWLGIKQGTDDLSKEDRELLEKYTHD